MPAPSINSTQAGRTAAAAVRLGRLSRQLRSSEVHLTAAAAQGEARALLDLPGSFVWPTGGLFIDDYSRLPQPTTDISVAKRDMDVYGYCILQNMLSPERLTRLLEKLTEQAEHDGIDPAASHPRNFPILASMQNKGSEYLELLEDPKVLEIVQHVVGEHFIFQILNQAWHTGGKEAAPLHTDQWWFPPPTRYDRPVRLPTGSISRPGAYESTWHPEPPHENCISPSVRCTAIWMATDFTPDNGATRIMPGSHLSGRHPLVHEAVNSGQHLGSIPICGPAGSCALYDGRIWHQAGANLDCDVDQHTGATWRLGIFNHYCAPFMRSQEAISLTTDRQNVVSTGSEKLREMLGLSAWAGRGRVGSAHQLSGHEMGLPEMLLPPGAAPQFQEIKSLLEPSNDSMPSVMETSVIDRAAAIATSRLLPQPCSDVCKLQSDLETHGYCIVDGALSSDVLARVTHRTMDQAAAEAAAGVSDEGEISVGEPRQQHVWSLANKGGEFVSLMLHKTVNQLVRQVLGNEYQLSHCTAIINHPGPGGTPEQRTATINDLGMDQWWMPQPVDKSQIAPKVRPGSVTATQATKGETSSASKHVIAPAVTLDVIWPLSKFMTSVCPGSHKKGRHPTQDSEAASGDDVVDIYANPGNCIVVDGRLWQSLTSTSKPSRCRSVGGHNMGTTCLLQYNYCAPQFRAVENHQLSVRPEILGKLPKPVLALLGFRPWNSYGSEFGRGNEHVYTGAQRHAVAALLADASTDGPSLAEQLLQAGHDGW